jgi:hypothetical protein
LKEKIMEFKLVVNEKEFPIEINAKISLAEQELVADSIVDGIFANDKYSPVRYTYVFWREVLRAYTNLDVDVDEDAFMDIISDESNDLIAEVKEAVNHVQLDNIENAVDELIAARLNRSEFDVLCANANRLLNKWDEKLTTFLGSKKGKLILGNLAKAKFNEQDLVNAVLASQSKRNDVKS